MRSTPAAFLAAVLYGTAAVAQHAPHDPLAARVDSHFTARYRGLSPGLAVSVVRGGQVVLRRGYGLANLEHRIPITPSTVFDVASVSKQFTGLAVAMLVTEGKLRPGDDVRAYVPELPAFGRPITIAHLLHHTSGLRDWPGALSVAGWRFDDVISFGNILTLAYHQRTLNFEPGAEHLYSNTGYNLLAEVVQRVTGRPFREWTDERIFRPLGMSRTHFRDDHRELIPDRATGYERTPDGRYRTVPNNLVALGSSSLFSTVDDLARWMLNFDRAEVGGRAAVDMLRSPGALNDGSPVPYAFGVLNGSYRGMPMFTHSGSWAAFRTYLVYMPEQRLGIAVLANADAIDAQAAVIEIANIYLEPELAAAPAGRAPPRADTGAARPRAVDVPLRTLAAYEGLYRLGPGRYVRVRRDGARLTLEDARGRPATLSARSEREFTTPDGASLAFHRDGASRVARLEYDGRPAARVDESRTPGRPAEYAGTYESPELGTTYDVVAAGDGLELRHRRHGTIPLARLHGDDFGSAVWFLRSVEFRRDASGRVTGFAVTADPRNRDIRFVRTR